MRTKLVRRISILAAVIAGALAVLVGPAPSASSAITWAPASTATVRPGVQMITDGGQCTANFVFTDAAENVYLGYAAHCAGTGAATETNGCDSGSLPLGTPVQIQGATQAGTLVYSSWLAMQAAGETNGNACEYNDFALVRVANADKVRVNPSIPHWGGPTALNTTGVGAGSLLYSYGNSSLRQGIELLSPKTGISLGTTGGGWTHPAYTITPGIPGDSGSALLDSSGRAVGVLSTLGLLPLPLSNNHADLSRALAYAQAHSNLTGLALAPGTQPFNSNQLPLGIGLRL